MAKKFKHGDVMDLHKKGYKPRLEKGAVVCDAEPPANFTPTKKDSLKQAVDKKRDK